MAVAAGVVPDPEGAEASLRDVLAAALEANRELTRLAGELREENARLRAENVGQAAELEKLRADLAVLQRMVFGRSSERSRPEPPGSDAAPGPGGQGGGAGAGKRRGPGARAGRRDYSHLPRVEVVWDFGDGGYCCPECGTPFTGLGSDHVTEQLDWLVVVRVRADCRRRYRRACDCRVPATVTAPGPPKAIGKGLFTNAFLAMLFTERFVAGRSMNSLATGLARQGAEIAAGTLAGACAQAGALLAPLEEAITARSRGSWHLHADETTWRVLAPRDGDGPAKWWLWVFLGPDTACFVMDPSRAGTVLARHAGIDEKTGQLTPDDDDGEPRRLVISSDFYAVYQSAGKKAGGLVNLYCWAHIRRYFVRAGDTSPAQLAYWTAAWLERIKDLYAAHAQLMTAWAQAAAPAPREAAAAAARLDEAGVAWAEAIGVIDEARKKQVNAPGLQEPAKKALATLNREWDGLIAHRDYPMIGLDNNPAERALRRPVVTRKNAYGSRHEDAARLAARIWTVTATAQMAGLNDLTYLTAYLDECGRNSGKPLTGPGLERFLPWNAAPADLRAWAQPPAPG
ncbi:MAG TPA: IS66 family transposase [Streptosporangiaceae bacterium]